MSEQKEDIDILSQKELEDGEIEEGELDEPQLISAVDNETELNTEVLDDSDSNINDKSTPKIKKHKHHKKGLHRKRHLNSEEKSDGKWKKSKKSNDEDDDDFSPELIDDKNSFDGEHHQSENISNENSFKHNEYNASDKMQPNLKWDAYESDDDNKVSNNFNKISNQSVLCGETLNKIKNKEILLSPTYEASPKEVEVPPPSEPHEISKWNDYDTDDETNANSSFNPKKNTFDDNQNSNTKNFKRWDSNKNNDRDRGRDNNFRQNNENRQSYNSPNRVNDDLSSNNNRVYEKIDLSNSPIDDKVGCASPSNKTEDIDKKAEVTSPKSNIDNFGKWGSFDSGDEATNDNQAWVSSSSPKGNDDNNKWSSRGGNDTNQRWGSRNDDDSGQKWGSRNDNNNNGQRSWGSRNDNDNDQRWGSRDSPKRDDDNNNDDSHRWGSRDGSRRRRWGGRDGRDGSRRNNSRRWGGRNGGQRNNDYQKWGSSNNGSPQRGSSDNKRWGSNNGSPQRTNDDNDKWGSSNNASPQRSYNDNNKRWGSSNNTSPSRNIDDKKWGSSNNSPQRWGSPNNSPQKNDDNNKFGSNNNLSPQHDIENSNQASYDLPQKSAWGAYSDDDDDPKPSATDNKTNTSTRNDSDETKWGSNNSPQQRKTDNFDSWDTQTSPKPVTDSAEPSSVANKWGYDSDDEGKPTVKENTFGNDADNNQSSWKSYDSDGESKGTFNDNRNKGGYNNSWNKNDRNDYKNDRNDFKNDRGDFKNDRNKRWTNEKRNVCKYFSMGSCRHGDRCTFLHESPTKPVTQEAKKKELCKFYEHQQCYKRANCTFMHEEFPCKLFHAGSKMCPSGDSCKYSHAPLNQESKALLEKYLDEKVDERTEKNSTEWSSIIKKSNDDDLDDNTPTGFDPPESFFPDPTRYRFPGGQDMMRFPVRPWNAMMRYSDMSMPVPHQMDFMHRQRFAAYPMNAGRMFPRNFRGMVPPNMHEGFPNGMPFSIPPLMSTNPKLHTTNMGDLNVSDPYIDNLAQLVVGKDSMSSPKRLVDMLDPNMQCDDMDDFPLEVETTNSKQSLSSPIMMKSPEIPPGAYVPRTSMNVAQPNVRLGPGPGYGGEQAMMYGGYPGHPVETTMMDYINMSAIHYYHNEAMAAYDVPWKPLLLEVPIKIPYPLMVIDTQDLPHKHTDPRLKGHPSVLNSNSTNEDSVLHHNSYDFNSISNFGSQLSSSPNFVTGSSEASENMTPMADFLSKVEEPESPMYPIGGGTDDFFSFKARIETEDYGRKNTDRSYLQDPRFKRKKVILSTTIEPSDMME